tara:strand:+ start:261 stop:839 length:579 start_codon:yes stop_codon:yes gene_type:complete
MALNKNKLKQGLIDNYSKLAKDGGSSKSESADGMATAIIDFMKDAEIVPVGSPALTPAVPSPIPDPTSLGTPLKVSGIDGAKAPLKGAILSSFNLEDPTMTQITSGIVAAAALMISFGNPTIKSATGASVMSIPPILAPAVAVGMGGGSIDDVCDSMATIITASFLGTLFSGAVIHTAAGAVIPGVITSKII